MPWVDAMKSEGWDEVERDRYTESHLYRTLLDLQEHKTELAGDPFLIAYLERDLAMLTKLVSDIKAMAPKVAA